MIKKFILCILYTFCFALPAFAQGDVSFVGSDIIGMDVSFQIGSIKTPIGIYNGTGVVNTV